MRNVAGQDKAKKGSRKLLFNFDGLLQFFAAFLLLYFLCRNSLPLLNLLILGSSWLFYGWWDWRFWDS